MIPRIGNTSQNDFSKGLNSPDGQGQPEKLVKKTNYECLVCSQYILFGQDLEIHHILPCQPASETGWQARQGGSDEPRN
jgi:hypothetical protein